METYPYVRAAQPEDVFILLMPTEEELACLREYQSGLQAVLGGRIVAHVHVTCQRFKPDHTEHMWEIVSRLAEGLGMVAPFPLMSGSLVTLHSEFWRSYLARWQVRETAECQFLNSKIRLILQELSCQPHYPGDKLPTCSALEQIPVLPLQADALDLASPEVLFEARQVVITKIEGHGLFTTLKTFQLGQGISETTRSQPQQGSTMKSTTYHLNDLAALDLHAQSAETVTWQGHPALRLNGLALLPGVQQQEGRVETWIGAEGTCYPGIAFRVQDARNYELVYPQPHTSGQWDALQYDPVMNGSNTWQLFHGLAYQKAVEVPTGRWFKLRVDYKGRRAAIWLDGQPPFVVERLAYPTQIGGVGLWSYLPAYFRDMKVSSSAEIPAGVGVRPRQPTGLVKGWQADGLGVLACEPGGALNLNRSLPVETETVTLRKRFSTGRAKKLLLTFGFSDELLLSLDGEQVYSGQHLWKDLPEWKERGYVDVHHAQLTLDVPAGQHELVARLRRTEYFGWGLIMRISN